MKAYPFACFITDKKNQILAGCSNGSMIFGTMDTDQLWVHSDRNPGLGDSLMDAVNDYGHKSGCLIAIVATMSFQGAETFYEQ